MNILIINAHSSKNKGDAGIVLSMIDSLKKEFPDCKIKIKSRFPELDANIYGEEVLKTSFYTKKSFYKILYTLKLLFYLNIKNYHRDNDYKWADVVLSCGGGYLLCHRFSYALLQHLFQIKLAIDYNKPVIIYAQSIGPFYNNLMQKLTKKVLNKVTKIFVREDISLKWLEKIGVSNKSVAIVPDSAFSMDMKKSDFVDNTLANLNVKSIGPLIGVTVRDWDFPEVTNKKEHRKNYICSIVETIKYLEEQYNASILLIPQVLGPNSFNDDRIISNEIKMLCGSKNLILLDYDFHPREIKYLYSKMDLFIGTRMHSNIFSLSNKIPTVAINYEHKTKGIMKMLELYEYVIDINEITPDSLIEKVDLCIKNKTSIINKLNLIIPKIIIKAQEPSKYINNLY